MKAEKIYNKAVGELASLAKDCIQQIARSRFDKGISDTIDYIVDPWEYNEDADNVIIWSDDYCGEIGISTIDINGITMDEDAKNIYLNGTNDEEVLFTELPVNSMVFVCTILENISRKELGE